MAAGLEGTLARPTFYVISPGVAEVARTFATRVAVAAAPDEDSILALLPAGA